MLADIFMPAPASRPRPSPCRSVHGQPTVSATLVVVRGLHVSDQESAWCEDHRPQDNGREFYGVAGLARARGPSVDWSGYWQKVKVAQVRVAICGSICSVASSDNS